MNRFYVRFVKPSADFVFSLLAILALSPFLLLTEAIIKLGSPGPVLFCQERIGKDRKRFTMYKFRTMRSDAPADVPTHLLENPESHITPIGRFLRKSSLDELPQLINVLKGDMSVVGPRPALYNQYDLEAERERHGANSLKPGITGWAQVMGRDELPIPVKAGLDGEYRHRVSPGFDLKIIFLTVFAVFGAKGVREGKS